MTLRPILVLALFTASCGAPGGGEHVAVVPVEVSARASADPAALVSVGEERVKCASGSVFFGSRCEPCKAYAGAARGTPEAEAAAECAYGAVDREIAATFDRRARYAGKIDELIRAYGEDLKQALEHGARLDDIVTRFDSKRWSVAARARKASLHDACWSGFEAADPPRVALYTDKERELLDKAIASGQQGLLEAAASIRERREEAWKRAREARMADTGGRAIRGYVEAVMWARAWQIRGPEVDRALSRLAHLTAAMTDEAIEQATAGLLDPATMTPFVYARGTFTKR